MSGNHLRSCAVGPTLSRFLAFFSDVSSSRIRACATTSAGLMIVRTTVALNIFHRLVIIIISSVVNVADRRQLSGDIDLFTLQKTMDNVSNLAIPGAEPAGIPITALRFGLHPEQVSLGGRGEFQDKYTTVRLRSRLCGRVVLVWDEAAVGGNHNQVELGVVERVVSLPPAEMHQVCLKLAHARRVPS